MENFEHAFETFTANPFVASLLGMVLYFLLLSGSKITLDPKLKFSQAIKKQLPHVLIGTVLAFAMVAYDDEIVKEYNNAYDDNFVWPWYFYLLGGVWLNLGYQVVALIPRLVKILIQKLTK